MYFVCKHLTFTYYCSCTVPYVTSYGGTDQELFVFCTERIVLKLRSKRYSAQSSFFVVLAA